MYKCESCCRYVNFGIIFIIFDCRSLYEGLGQYLLDLMYSQVDLDTYMLQVTNSGKKF